MTLQETNTDSSAPLDLEVTSADSSAGRKRRTALADGLRFGKYQITHLMAIGGMSEVYEAIHLGLHKRVALKVLHPELAENAEARQRFLAEGVHAARLRHTHVVDVSDVGMVDELPFLVMELLEGDDLAVVYAREKCIPAAELLDLLLPVACAVTMGHAKGVIHRDLKPDNIFMHREGRRVIPKVLDFGVSRATSGRGITLDAHVFGTPHYMSPEQARGAPTDARTDQYSLGVMLYEGLTGRLPHDSDNALQLLHAVANDPFDPPSAHVTLPDGLEDVILRAMASNPDDRFASMNDFVLALIPFANEAVREYWQLELAAISADARPDVLDATLLATLQSSQVATSARDSAPGHQLARGEFVVLTHQRKLQVLAAAGLVAALSCGFALQRLLQPRPYAAHISSSITRLQAATHANDSLASDLHDVSRAEVPDAPEVTATEARLTTSAHHSPAFEGALPSTRKSVKSSSRAKRAAPRASVEPEATMALGSQPSAPRVDLLPAPVNAREINPQPRVRILSAREPRVRLVD